MDFPRTLFSRGNSTFHITLQKEFVFQVLVFIHKDMIVCCSKQDEMESIMGIRRNFLFSHISHEDGML